MPNLLLTSIVIAVSLYVLLEIGGWLARDATSSDAPPASGIVFAVFGLLIAFTFTNSAQRFDERRELIVQHANAFDTAWSRLDLLAEDDREAVREPMRAWISLVDRIAEAQSNEDRVALQRDALRLQAEAWSAVIAAVQRAEHPTVAAIVLPPFNAWSDLTTLRRTRNDVGLPPMVLGTLIGLALLVALVAGYGMTRRGNALLLHKLAFTIAISVSLYVIMDLNAPRSGLINVNASDHILKELRDQTVAPPITPAAP